MTLKIPSDLKSNKKSKSSSKYTHSLHPYPCEFPASVPRAIIKEYVQDGMVIFDPFAGSGTTLVEASLAGFDSIGVDVNPIACLLSRTKSTPVSPKELAKVDDYLKKFSTQYNKATSNNFSDIPLHSFRSIDHWFQKNVVKELSFLRTAIKSVKEDKLKDFFWAVLSSIIVRVSNQESDTRYAAVEKNIEDDYTLSVFTGKAKKFKDSLLDFWSNIPRKEVTVKVFLADTRNLKHISDNSADIVITSPPYANTYDYYLYHKHRMNWLGMDVSYAQYNEIGSRREFSSLKKSPEKWGEDITECMAELRRVTKPGGKMFIIIGDSIIDKCLIKGDDLLNEVARNLGLQHVETHSAPLSKRSKRFNPAFRKKNKEEHLIFYKNTKSHD